MKNNLSLPYPVLGINDDVFPLLGKDCMRVEDPVIHPTKIVFRIHLKQENETITKLIAEGSAEYVCEINGPRSMFRNGFLSQEPDFEIELPRHDLRGTVSFECFVIVRKRIPEYSNPQFNEDYEGVSFDMEPGDILVFFGKKQYNMDIRYDKFFSAGSFIKIQNSRQNERKTWVNLNSDKVLIMLPPKEYEKYKKYITKSLSPVSHASWVFFALLEALRNADKSEYKDTEWSYSIHYLLKYVDDLKGYELSDTERLPELAQVMLNGPFERMLDCIGAMNGRDVESE